MTYSPDPARFAGNTALSRGASLQEATRLAEAWQNAVQLLEQREGFDDRWMPILATLGPDPSQNMGGLGVEFVNVDAPDNDPGSSRWVQLDGPEFEDFTKFLDGRLDALKKAFEYQGGTFAPKEEATEGDTIDGLNAMFVVQKLIAHFSGKDEDPGRGISNSRLATALRVHSYIQLAQYGDQAVFDVLKVIDLVRTLVRSEEAVQSSLSTMFRALGRVSEGLGVVLGAANVAFDAYELSQANTDLQKAVYGTQLGFDSASFLAVAGSAGAGLLGASSVAAILGGAGVLLTGIGIGVGALVEAFGEVAESAKAVGKYFGDADAAYRNGGYEYDAEKKILKPLVGAVIDELDTKGHIQFDSQYIYRTHHGSTGSGYENYFFWAGDFPKMIVDKSQALNIREKIGRSSNGTLPNVSDFVALILPCTPKSYIRYEWQILPFATARKDYGFDILRKLEVGEKFDYDFYIFPSEYIINRIFFDYVATTVTVKLDSRSMRVQAPQFPESMQGFMHYALEGADAEYVVGLEAGVSFSLSGSSGARWILDPRDLKNDTIVVKDASITIGGVQVSVTEPSSASVLIVTKDSQVLRVDFANLSAEPAEEDASKYPGGSQKLVDHLNDLNAKHELHGSFVVVDNYTTPSGDAVGRAYYEVSNKRLLYTSGAPLKLTKNAQLVGYTAKGEVFFCSLTESVVWRVDPTSGAILAKYEGFYPSTKRKLVRVWQENDFVHATYNHPLGGDLSGELSYILQDDSMKLVSMVGDPTVLNMLSQLDKWRDPLDELLQGYLNNTSGPSALVKSLPGTEIKPTIDPTHGVLSVFGQIPNGPSSRYWIRLADKVVIKGPPSPPSDIVFAGTVPSPLGDAEECCFYSWEGQVIILEKGTGVNTGEPRAITVPDMFGKLRNVFCVNDVIFVVTTAGYILRLTQQGTFFLEAVNEQWFNQDIVKTNTPWWIVLKEFAAKLGATTVSILGLRDVMPSPVHDAKSDLPIIPAWLCDGKLVVASQNLYDTQVGVAGLAQSGREAWLCHWDSEGRSQLYIQPLLSEDELRRAFPDVPNHMLNNAPEALPVLRGYPFKSVAMTNNGLQYTTTDGVVLIVATPEKITLYGVDDTWQYAHFMSLESDLGKLAKQWTPGEVIALLGRAQPAWFLVSAGKVLSANDGFGWEDSPRWLGADASADGVTGYVYLAAHGPIVRLTPGQSKGGSEDAAAMAVRFDNLLVLEPSLDTMQFMVPALEHVEYAMVSQPWLSEMRAGTPGGNEQVVCVVSEACWMTYRETVVQWHGNARIGLDASKSDLGDLSNIVAKKIGDDLSIFDVRNGRTLTLRKVFNHDADPLLPRPTIMFGQLDGLELRIADIQNALEGRSDITLKDLSGRG